MGGNVCRAIHSRYCGGNLHFNEDVRAKFFLGLINDTLDFAFFLRLQAKTSIPICGKENAQIFEPRKHHLCPCFVRESSVAAFTVL